ncbi:hypothetical protein DDE01_15190 [Desulfovibrio desulfuricans]|nr:hypothetical protein DDE01_15190 [Desulfovibrio desulfuricans]
MEQGFDALDFTRLELMCNAEVTRLAEADYLEREILPGLGLNGEKLHQFPAHLHAFCGQGLRSWQYPNQFGRYLATIARFPVQTYVEIGVRHGGTFVVTLEYLRRFNPLVRGLGIDIFRSPALEAYREHNPRAAFLQVDSRSERFRRLVDDYPVIDLAFIDGDHSFDAVRSDFALLHGKARLIGFHDIVNDDAPGCPEAWQSIRFEHARDYVFMEFTEQYFDTVRHNGMTFLGIGLAIRRDTLPAARA